MEKYLTIEHIQQLIAKLTTLGAEFGVKLVTAIAIFIIGRWVAIGLKNLIDTAMRKAKVDETLISFTVHLSYIAMIAFVVIAALGQLGIQTTSFIAVLGAAGLAVGLALQGSLSNFAAGVLMLIFRPFKVGDYVEGAGVAGSVKEIQIFTTILTTPDNKTIIVPNAKITGDNITNYATQGTRRIDMAFAIAYNEDIDKAKRTLLDLIKSDNRLLENPAPQIAVGEAGNGRVNILCRPWVKADDYWDAYFDMMETVKKRFDAENIKPPVPRQDIHLFQQNKP
ncbi:MAG: mechanosensitive ion channel family protein [Desulfobacteraceae bacterium]|nr:MAG: mechanosensitive ion channel family protein [Desulfobacteraceae bacterium]